MCVCVCVGLPPPCPDPASERTISLDLGRGRATLFVRSKLVDKPCRERTNLCVGCPFVRSFAPIGQDVHREDQPGLRLPGLCIQTGGAGRLCPADDRTVRPACVPALSATCGPDPHRGILGGMAAVGERRSPGCWERGCPSVPWLVLVVHSLVRLGWLAGWLPPLRPALGETKGDVAGLRTNEQTPAPPVVPEIISSQSIFAGGIITEAGTIPHP